MYGGSRTNIYDRWYEKSGKAQVLEAQKVKNENLQKLRSKLAAPKQPRGPKMQHWDALLTGLRKATKSLLSAKKHVARGDEKSASGKFEDGFQVRPKTQHQCLYKQKLMQTRMKRFSNNWSVGVGAVMDDFEKTKATDGCGDLSDKGTVYSDDGKWAKSGTWPSHFSSNEFKTKTKKPAFSFAQEATYTCSDSGSVKSKRSLYERWFVSHKADIFEAQRRVKELKRSKRLLRSTSARNANRLKRVFESNHLDDHQDAIQGKKFTYEWILEQESLIENRLDNLIKGLPADEIDHETWKYADCINSIYPWEQAVVFDFEDCS